MAHSNDTDFQEFERSVRACTLCDGLPLGPRPILQIDPRARILIAGQAPGRITHARGRPFDDKSGERLRAWMGVDETAFYDASKIAIVPMGLCFPGSGSSGDMAPRPECAPAWRDRILTRLPNIEATLVIGRYALDWHIGPPRKTALTDIVRNCQGFAPSIWPLPHPSPRNNRWLKRNPWFETDVLPALKTRIAQLLDV